MPLLGATPNLTTAERTAFLPRLPFVYSRADSGSILTTLQWQPFRESIDLIYENIQLLNSNSVLNSLVVTNAIAGEGKSTLTLALATSAARRHQKVLIVDANLRNPTLHFELNLSNQNGLSNFLNEATEIPTIEKASILDTTIDILTAGSQIPDPISLLSSSRLNELIKNLESLYDLVIIDTPPTLGMVDAIKVASHCSATVMVARLDRIESPELTEAAAILSQIKVLGVIANSSSEVRQRTNEQHLLPADN